MELSVNPRLNKNLEGRDCAVVVKNLSKSYQRNVSVLKNVCMSVDRGTVYGLLGSSGCGKSTLLGCIMSLKEWDTGEVFLFGDKVSKDNAIKGRNIGYMPQDLALYDHLSVLETMKYYSKLYGMNKKEFDDRMSFIEELVDLPGFRSRWINTLSGGQKRRVSLSLTLIHSPKLLILDEPTVGLDPLLRERLWNYLYNLTNTNKTTIVITTHYIEEVKRSHKVGVMRKGRILIEEDPKLLMQLYNTEILDHVVRNICFMDDREDGITAVVHNGILKYSKSRNQQVSLMNLCQDHGSGSQNVQDVNSWRSICHNDKDCGANSEHENFMLPSILRSLAYSKIVWTNFIRHPMFIFFALFLPVFQLFSTGVVFGVEPKYTRIGIVNYEIPRWSRICNFNAYNRNVSVMDRKCELNTLSCDFIKYLYAGNFIEPVEFIRKEDAHYAVQRGETRGYIQIPANFSQHIVERAAFLRFAEIETIHGTEIKMNMDMADFITMFTVLSSMFKGFSSFVKELTELCSFDLRFIDIPFLYKDPVYGEMEGSARDYALPALIGGILFEIALCVTPLVFVNDIKCGTFERSKTAGLGIIEWMMGLIITMASLACLQAVMCYVALEYGLNFRVQGNILVYFSFCMVTIVCGGTFGLLIGVIFKDEMIVIISAIFIMPVLMVHVGILRIEEVLPIHYRSFVYHCFPSAAIVRSFRFLMTRGVGLLHPQVWPGVFITLGWSVVYSVLTLIVLKFSAKK